MQLYFFLAAAQCTEDARCDVICALANICLVHQILIEILVKFIWMKKQYVLQSEMKYEDTCMYKSMK